MSDKKIHYGNDNGAFATKTHCEKYFVSDVNVTIKKEKVTCKNCLMALKGGKNANN